MNSLGEPNPLYLRHPSELYYDNSRQLYRAIVGKVEYKQIPEYFTNGANCIYLTLLGYKFAMELAISAKRDFYISPLSYKDEAVLNEFFNWEYEERFHFDNRSFLKAYMRDSIAEVYFYTAQKCGTYKGEDSGASYSEYDEIITASFQISRLDEEYFGHKASDLVEDLQQDGADWPPAYRHGSLISFLRKHRETAVMPKGNFLYLGQHISIL